MTMESSLLLAIIWSPLEEKSIQLTRSVFSLNTLATRKERKTSSVSFIFDLQVVRRAHGGTNSTRTHAQSIVRPRRKFLSDECKIYRAPRRRKFKMAGSRGMCFSVSS